MTETELEYLRRRTAEELDIADHSHVGVAAEAHRRLAMLYASRVAEMRQFPDREEMPDFEQAPGPQQLPDLEIVDPMIMPHAAAGPRSAA
jgi:hypothetical protein